MEVEGTAAAADGGTAVDLPPKAADGGGSSPQAAAPVAAVAEAAEEQDGAGQVAAPEEDAGPAAQAVPADGADTSPQAAAAAGPTEVAPEVAPERAAAPTPAAGATSPVPEQAQEELQQRLLENTQTAQTGPTPLAPAPLPETAKPNRYETKGARQCKSCGGWGHFAKTCPLRFGPQPPDGVDATTPAEAYAGPWTQPPDASKVLHARDGSKGGKGGPTPRPYSGSEKGRYEKLQEIGVVAGEWKPQEDAALMALVDLEGPGDWTTKSVTLGAACGFRSSTAIRKRYNRLAGIEGPAKSTGSGDLQGIKRKVPPEFDQGGASASVAGEPFPRGGICKGCIPRSKAKHTCGRQYSKATAARRYGANYASRGYGSDGKILQNPRGSPSSGREVSLMNQRNVQSQLPSCAACERQRKGCVHAVDIIPAPLSEVPLPPDPKQDSPNQGNIPKGECDFCRRRDGGETLRTGCGCRDSFYGFAGYAHVSCLMKAAEDDDQILHDCPKCEQRWKGELAIELSRIKRSRSAEGPKGKRRPEDPDCVRATVDLVATLCIAAVENQNLEYYKSAASLGQSTIDLLKGCFTLGPSRFSTRPQGSEQWETAPGVRSIELVNLCACLGKLFSDTGNHRAAVPLLTDAVDGMSYLHGDAHPYTLRLNHSLRVSTKSTGGEMCWPRTKTKDMMRAGRSRDSCVACQAPHSDSRHTCIFRYKIAKFEDAMRNSEEARDEHCPACQGRNRPHTCAPYSQQLQLQVLLNAPAEKPVRPLPDPNHDPSKWSPDDAVCKANDQCEKSAFCSRGYHHRGHGGQCNGQRREAAYRAHHTLLQPPTAH